jgi:hypothetical protein
MRVPEDVVVGKGDAVEAQLFGPSDQFLRPEEGVIGLDHRVVVEVYQHRRLGRRVPEATGQRKWDRHRAKPFGRVPWWEYSGEAESAAN